MFRADQPGEFSWPDYVAFGILVAASCAGGLWYSALGSRTRAILDVRDYLLGGRTMATFPVALSLIASYVSGVTVLGTPTEIYNFGSQYWLVIVAVALSGVAVCVVYLPVFCTLRLSSSYEYLDLRFNRHVRAAASILFMLDEIFFLPMVVYVPALAFNQLTGMNVYLIAGVMVLVCGLYTVLGGLRAVVWTDALQIGVMFSGVVLVAAAGTSAAGGFGKVFSVARETNRLDFSNWSFSPFERQTGWGALIGGFLYWTCFNSVNQTMVQRYLALPTKRQAVIAIGLFSVGAVGAISLCVWCGLAAWAVWIGGGCGPGAAPPVDDRLLPALVTHVAQVKNLPGLAGVFLAGVFGAGLSSLSAVLNACALVGVEDLARGWLRLRLRPLTEGLLARCITAVLALCALAMMLVIEKLGGVLSVATTLSAIAASTTCGVFTLGMCCWWVGPKGALSGAIAGAIVAGTVAFGAQTAATRGLKYPIAEFPMECMVNSSYVPSHSLDPEAVFPLFRLSYHWVAPLGLTATLLVGAVFGWLCDRPRTPPDPDLMSPIVWRWLPKQSWELAGSTRRGRAVTPGAQLPDPLLQDVHSTEGDKLELNAVSSR